MAAPFRPPQELEHRKRLALVAGGAVVGGGLTTVITACLAAFGGTLLVGTGGILGALVGGALGETIASRVDMGPWEPLSAGRSYVGTNVPDDDAG